MSQENVDLVGEHYLATNEGDFARAMSHYAEDVELVVPSGHLRSGTFRGRDEVGRYFGEFFATFDAGARFDIKEIRDLGESSVLLVAVYHARGRASGVDIAGDVIWLYRLSDGRITRVRWCDNRSEALRAAGLEEEAVSENLALVRSIYADWERGDLSSSLWAHPDIEYVAHGGPAQPPARYTGVAAMAEGAREFVSAWDRWTILAEKIQELDDERVLVLNRYHARGKNSGIAVEQQGAHVFVVRDGRVTRLTVYPVRDRAIADLGLEE